VKNSVLELHRSHGYVIRCFGVPRALDAFPDLGAASARVATDELWLVGPSAGAPGTAAKAKAWLAGADPDSLVIDHSEAWAAWSISSDSMAEVLARIVDFRLAHDRDGFHQGMVLQVPAKILVRDGRLHLIAPVQLSHHVAERFMKACGDLSPAIGPDTGLDVGSR
jgi:hypothetical protein